MQMRVIGAGVAVLVALAGCDTIKSGGAASERDAETEAPALDRALAAHLPAGVRIEVAERGRELFPTCGVCHGMEGEGTQLGPPLRDADWIHISGTIEEIAGVARSGVPSPREYPIPMPVLGGGNFDDEDIRALATYVFLLSRSGSPAGRPARADTASDTTAAAPVGSSDSAAARSGR